MIIYNLFPRLLGKIEKWQDHIKRISDMNFTHIYINPFHLTGYSGSLYSIKDYDRIDHVFSSNNDWDEFKNFVNKCHENSLKVLLDLVINHTANESILVQQHPNWYRYQNGYLKHPGCMEGDHFVEWGDLAEIENDNGSHINDLWKYWENLIYNYLDLGVDGFRCDCAYKVPSRLWSYLIDKSHKKKKDVVFLAETLGCSCQQTESTAKSGFDYIFNSSKWWNFYGKWCIDNYWSTKNFVKSISFPESHDTERLSKDTNGSKEISKQRYLFSCFFSSGVMIPIGYEWGFKQKLHVVYTTDKMEWGPWDISDFISKSNKLKLSQKIFLDECNQYMISDEDSPVLVLKKQFFDQESIMILNKTDHSQSISHLKFDNFKDVSIEKTSDHLAPFQIKILCRS